ncbi:acyl-CoA thioesterase [Nocardioides baekrokdamisoli]|uniref:acyl-CoA thioesterase n=1 Tax=Nocardioides baekrokdamisoli TaxID=1804624 RepID=UPI001E424AAC|nr:acyl-CoA thioesterase [Nocardioides baekrokdamisoli]
MTESEHMQPPSFGSATLSVLMRPTEANLRGTIHGGEILKLADTTAGTVGYRWSGGVVVTAYLDEMAFLEPVQVGDILTTQGQVNWTGRTSFEVGVRIETQRYDDTTGTKLHVGSAYFLMVAVDREGRPRPVPAVKPETVAERSRYAEAEIRRTHRLARKAEIAARRSTV